MSSGIEVDKEGGQANVRTYREGRNTLPTASTEWETDVVGLCSRAVLASVVGNFTLYKWVMLFKATMRFWCLFYFLSANSYIFFGKTFF